MEDSAWRILWPLFAVGAFDKPNNNSAAANVCTPKNTELAKTFAAAGTVLLKNDANLLPISTKGKVKTIAVVGGQAERPTVTGGGSGAVGTRLVVSPLAAIRARLGLNTTAGSRAAPPRCNSEGVCLDYCDGRNLTNASLTAAAADVTLVFVGTTSVEGTDRADLSLGGPKGQVGNILLLLLLLLLPFDAGKRHDLPRQAA